MLTARRRDRWNDDRSRRFVEDWNDQMPALALREKYGIRHPAVIARMLRGRGWKLARRGNR